MRFPTAAAAAAALALSIPLASAHPTSSSLLRRAPSPGAVDATHFLSLPQERQVTARRLEAQKATIKAVRGEGKAKAGAGAGAGGGAKEDKGKEEEEKGDEVDIEGTFGTPLALKGGDLRQDITFQATVGKFEVEFQAKDARTLTVTENKTPGAAPAGFAFLEPSSFKIDLAEGGDNLTFGSADLIFDTTNKALAGVDLSTSKIGKLCTETKTFIIDDTIGEAEFEADENEVALRLKNLNGEFGIFVPQAAGTGAGEGKGKGGGASEGAAGEEDKAGQIEVTGMFGSINKVEANVFTNLNFAANAAGALEVEHNSTSANNIRVVPKLASVRPPAGHLFVDPLTFVIATANPPAAGDKLKVDYKFTEGVKAAIDASKGLPGKLDPATNQFVTTGLGEFEFEEDENEWSLAVTDLNGEWAFFVPQAAVL